MSFASAPANDQGPLIGHKYRLDRQVGEGGMATVWRAFNVQLEMPVAIKFLRPGLASPDFCQRLRVEARAAAQFVHPAIVRIFDIEETDEGEPCIVMELLEGESLGDKMDRGRIPAIELVQLVLPIAEGLSYVHSHGLVHRDLKPDNIFLTVAEGRLQPKLLDFGIAKAMRSVAPRPRSVTQGGNVVGSPAYMSPEQACGVRDLDQRADVWSMCVVLYEALAGRPAFVGESCTDVLRSVLDDEPEPLDDCGVDPALSRIIFKGLTKARESRTQTITGLSRELAEWLSAQGVHEDAAGTSIDARWLGRATSGIREIELLTWPRKRRWPRVVAVALGLAATGGAAWAVVPLLLSTGSSAGRGAQPPQARAHPPISAAQSQRPIVLAPAPSGPPVTTSEQTAPVVTAPVAAQVATPPARAAVLVNRGPRRWPPPPTRVGEKRAPDANIDWQLENPYGI